VGVGAEALVCACARVALLIQHATRMRHIAIWGLSGSTSFFDIISATARFSGKGAEHKMCVFSLYNVSSKYFLFYEEFSEILP
jgi:hypothetical protein